MNEQNNQVVTLLQKMLHDKQGQLEGIQQAMKDCENRMVDYQVREIAYSAAVKALTNEITKWKLVE